MALDQQRLWQPERRQVLVVGDILPVIAKILGRERLAIGPLVALTQMQRENAAVDVVDALQDVRRELQRLVVADEPRVPVHRHHPDVAVLGEQRANFTAVAAERPVRALRLVHERDARQALRDRRNLAGRDVGREDRRLVAARRCCAQRGCEQRGEPEREHSAAQAAGAAVAGLRR